METKQITLRSQTVQCPHCGECYSVTYKYCPFCDVGRQEEERRMAERKKQRQQKLGGIFGSALAGLLYGLWPRLPFVLAVTAWGGAVAVAWVYSAKQRKI